MDITKKQPLALYKKAQIAIKSRAVIRTGKQAGARNAHHHQT
ncbi:hypothetical protein [Hydrogenophaga soli]